MSEAIHSTPPIPKEIARKLGSLRRGISTWLLIRGLSRLVIAFVALASLDFVIDRYFEMDLSQRTILMIVIGIALVSILIWDFIRPFTGRTRDDALLLEVEKKHQDLNESLISAAQFSRQENLEAQGVSQAMVDATIEEGTLKAKAVSFTSVLDSSKLLTNSVMLLIGVGVIGLASYEIARKDSSLSIWFKRNVLLSEAEYPRKTYLYFPEIEGDTLIVARGENVPVLVAIPKSSEMQDVEVFLDYRDAGESYFTKMKRQKQKQQSDVEETVDAENTGTEEIANESGERRFTGAVNKVSSRFRFCARGGDGATRWINVDLVEPPAVSNLVLNITRPEYTGTQPHQLEGSGPHSVLNGSSMSLSANSNKRLKQAFLITPSGEKIDLLNNDDETKLSANIPTEKLISGKYKFSLADYEGLETDKLSGKPASFGIKIRPDQTPVVRARLEGISGLVVSRAIIPIKALIRDDYQVTDAKWAYNWKGDTSDSAAVEGEISFEDLDETSFGRKEVSIAPMVNLEPLNIPAQAGLRFTINASDNDTIAGPNIGRSTEFLLRVVTEDELRADLLRREKEQRQEFDRLYKEQKELLLEAEAMQADSPENVKDLVAYYSDKNRELIALSRRQKLLGTNLGTIADRFQDFLIETLNNQIEDKGGRLRSEIIAPLRQLSEEDVPRAHVYIEASRRSVKKEGFGEAIGSVVTEQQRIIDTMARISVNMAKSESFQEAVAALREIKKSEDELIPRVRKEKADRIADIFGTDEDQDKDEEKPEKEEPEEGENQ